MNEAGLRRRNPRGNGSQLREEVTAAAMRLLDRSPAMDLSLRTIAREVGVAAPSLYSQFPDARAVLEHVARECWRQLAEAMDGAEAALEAASPLERLQARLAAYVDYAMAGPSRYQLLISVLVDTRGTERAEGPLAPIESGIRRCVEALAPGLRPGEAEAGDPAELSLQIISLCHGRIALAHLALQDPANSAREVARFVARGVGRILA